MLDGLGNIGDFIGGIGVVVTLVYFAVQVRQHTATLRTASRQNLTSGYRAHNGHLINPQVAEAYARGLEDYPNMPAEQKRIFALAINDHALFLQTALALYESGDLGIENYSPYLTWLACLLATPGGTAWWNEVRGFYNSALVESIDSRLAQGGLRDARELGYFALDR
jgi:hypothetical protein